MDTGLFEHFEYLRGCLSLGDHLTQVAQRRAVEDSLDRLGRRIKGKFREVRSGVVDLGSLSYPPGVRRLIGRLLRRLNPQSLGADGIHLALVLLGPTAAVGYPGHQKQAGHGSTPRGEESTVRI